MMEKLQQKSWEVSKIRSQKSGHFSFLRRTFEFLALYTVVGPNSGMVHFRDFGKNNGKLYYKKLCEKVSLLYAKSPNFVQGFRLLTVAVFDCWLFL